MSDFDPFDPALRDEAEELQVLKMALRRAQGFALFLVRCNDPAQRRDIIAALRADRPDSELQSIELREPIRHLLDELQNRVTAPKPDAVLVGGLEYSLPDSQNAAKSPFVANLNAARNSFPRVVSCPLVLFVPEYALVAIMRGAPDFYSVRSGLYFFARTPEASRVLAIAMLEGAMWQATSLSVDEKTSRIHEIKNLLADYRLISENERDPKVEIGLLTRLSGLLFSTGNWGDAEFISQSVHTLALKSNDRTNQAIALQNLGNIYAIKDKPHQAEDALRESLKIFQELNDLRGVAANLNSLGLLYQSQKDWVAAEAFYQQGLTLIGNMDDPWGKSRTLNNLGMIWQLQNQNERALDAYQSSLTIKRSMGDNRGEAYTLANLGNLYLAEGRWKEAENNYKAASEIFRQQGDCVALGRTFNNLALLWFRQDDLEEARRFAVQGQNVLKDTQAQNELEKSRWILEDIEALQTQK